MPQPPNLGALLQQAQKMQEEMMAAQEKLKDERVEASAGGGMVKVVMSGDLELKSLAIDPDAVDPEDVEMLQDMVLAAVNEALRQAMELQGKASGMGGMDPSAALDALGGLGGLGGARRRAAAAGCRAARRPTAPRGAGRGSSCSPRPSSAWSPSSASSPASATAPRSGSRSTCCARRPRTPTRSPTRSARSRSASACARSASTSPRARAARSAQDERRDAALICVVEEPGDVIPIERTHEYRGRYHVLGGALSPIDGVEPEDLKLAAALRARRARRPAGARGRARHQPDHDRRGDGAAHRRRAAPARPGHRR